MNEEWLGKYVDFEHSDLGRVSGQVVRLLGEGRVGIQLNQPTTKLVHWHLDDPDKGWSETYDKNAVVAVKLPVGLHAEH